jgi:hypothetical protein
VFSVQSVFQALAWTELWHIGFLDFNRSARTGVATCASSPLAHGKCAKTHQGNRATFFQGGAHSANGGFKGATGCRFGQISVLGNVFDQFCFVHKKPLGVGAGRTDVGNGVGVNSMDMLMKFVQALNA